MTNETINIIADCRIAVSWVAYEIGWLLMPDGKVEGRKT